MVPERHVDVNELVYEVSDGQKSLTVRLPLACMNTSVPMQNKAKPTCETLPFDDKAYINSPSSATKSGMYVIIDSSYGES